MCPDRAIYSHMIQNADGRVVEFGCAPDKLLRMTGATEEGKGGPRIELSKQFLERVSGDKSKGSGTNRNY